ncbi:MAG: hypothetical protein AUH85_08200 [Chloroflexi bacterium 13_1_40CM_4_68_4]|nr:MAG: hypothetical protein AUH85_08200 [Chloroflexi bacterium 13_1_40CM_4_68_4]
MAAFSAETDFSRPTPNGTTSLGKTMDSRSGTSGSVFGSCSLFFPLARASIVMTSPLVRWL